VHRAPALDDDDWSIDTNIALFIFFFGSAPQLSLLFRRGATLEFRCRQVRGVLLQRLINDERATAGLHRLELIGSNQLINAAPAFPDDCRGLADWDQDRLQFAYDEMLPFSLDLGPCLASYRARSI